MRLGPLSRFAAAVLAAVVAVTAVERVAWALVQTQRAGVVSIGDANVDGRQMTVNSDGSINVGGTSGTTLTQILAAIIAATLTPPIAVTASVSVTPTNCSGSITTGGTAQQLFAASATRHFYQIQNDDITRVENLGISEVTATPVVGAAGTWTLSSLTGSYTSPLHYVPNTAIFIVGATTGHTFTCVTW